MPEGTDARASAQGPDAAPADGGDVPAIAPLIVVRPGRGWARLGLGELWAYRELLGFLVWRDVKVRYKQTILGILWAVIQPVTLMVVLRVFLGRDMLWSYAGLLPWTYFSQALERSSNSLVLNRELLTKVYFPRLVMPLAGVTSPLVDLAIAGAVYFALLVWYGKTPGAELAYLPALVLFAGVAASAAGMWLSALNVKYRDVRHAIPFLVQAWLFASPVIYSSADIPEEYRMLYALNPMTGVVEGFRWCLLGEGALSPRMLACSVGMTAAAFVTGAFYFRRMERTFADVV